MERKLVPLGSGNTIGSAVIPDVHETLGREVGVGAEFDVYVPYLLARVNYSVTTGGSNTCPREEMLRWISQMRLEIKGWPDAAFDITGKQCFHLFRQRYGKIPHQPIISVPISQTGLARTQWLVLPFWRFLGTKGWDCVPHATAIRSLRIARDNGVLQAGTSISATVDTFAVLFQRRKLGVPVQFSCINRDLESATAIRVPPSRALHGVLVENNANAFTGTTTVRRKNANGDQVAAEIDVHNAIFNLESMLDGWAKPLTTAQVSAEQPPEDETSGEVLFLDPDGMPYDIDQRAIAKPLDNSRGTEYVFSASQTNARYVAVISNASGPGTPEGDKYVRDGRGLDPRSLTPVLDARSKTTVRATPGTVGLPSTLRPRQRAA